MLTQVGYHRPRAFCRLADALSAFGHLGRMNQNPTHHSPCCGRYSNRRLFATVLVPALFITLAVGWLSMVLSPKVARARGVVLKKPDYF